MLKKMKGKLKKFNKDDVKVKALKKRLK